MYNIRFYRDKNGREPVLDALRELKGGGGKDARINLNKIGDYIELLHQNGTGLGKPFIKHLEDDIWELRPLRNRVLFAAWVDGGFILLHMFVKKTQKTPKREILKAKRELREAMERTTDHDS